MGLEVAIIVNKVRVWGSPVGGVDGASSVLNLVGNGIVVPRPEPKVDGVGSSFSCVPGSRLRLGAKSAKAGPRKQEMR